MRGRPTISTVAGGYALRTKARFTPAIRAANPGGLPDDGLADLTRTETFALTAIAHLQPVTRGEISRLAGREISRDIIAALKRHGLIDGAIRAPQPGAPFAYVTTKTFLEAFGFASLRDLPDREQLKAESSYGREGRGERPRQRARGQVHRRSRRHIRRQRRGVGGCRGIMKGSCAAPDQLTESTRPGA